MGEVPSKKNSRINTKSGRSFPSARYTKWHKEVVSQLEGLLLTKQIQRFIGSKVKLIATFYHGDLTRRDSDNQLSSILDTLVDVGIIDDDNWKVIPLKLIVDEYDKGNPRCIIEIEEIPSLYCKIVEAVKNFMRKINERDTEEESKTLR